MGESERVGGAVRESGRRGEREWEARWPHG